jgi:hypothetical protein
MSRRSVRFVIDPLAKEAPGNLEVVEGEDWSLEKALSDSGVSPTRIPILIEQARRRIREHYRRR